MLPFFGKKGRRSRGHLGCKYPVRPPVLLPSSRRRATVGQKKATRNRHCILDGFWLPKCYQKPPKMMPKTLKKSLKNEYGSVARFLYDFPSNVACFRSCLTHDFTAIYSTFVGCIIFCKIRQGPKKHSKKTPKMIPKSMQNHFKNLSNKYARKKSGKTTKMSPKWSQKASQNFPENPGNRP